MRLFEGVRAGLEAAGSEGARVLVLGVTPELLQLPWPARAELQAVDHSAEMIAALWRPPAGLRASVRQAAWQQLPLATGSVDAVVGDGSLNALPDLARAGIVLQELARVMKPGARLALRCFVRAQPGEPGGRMTPAGATLAGTALAGTALAGAVPDDAAQADAPWAAAPTGTSTRTPTSFHALKWRLALALGNGPGFSVAVSDIHHAFERLWPDRDRLARHTGWARASIDTIDAYRGSATRLNFPTLAALQQVAAPWFELLGCHCGDYELAPSCPTLWFRPRAAARP